MQNHFDYDPPKKVFPEDSLRVPWLVDEATSWLAYQCWIEFTLDAGMALHKPLPQNNPEPDTFATVDTFRPDVETQVGNVNLNSTSTAEDVIQRISTSTYRFVLKGYGLRAGHKIPIPGIFAIAGTTPVPEGDEWSSGNVMVANFVGGIPIWYCAWRIPYMIRGIQGSQGIPTDITPIPMNPAMHIPPTVELPASIFLPDRPETTTPMDQATEPSIPLPIPIRRQR